MGNTCALLYDYKANDMMMLWLVFNFVAQQYLIIQRVHKTEGRPHLLPISMSCLPVGALLILQICCCHNSCEFVPGRVSHSYVKTRMIGLSCNSPSQFRHNK